MKKKIKDLTFKEWKKICENNDICDKCPIVNICCQTPIYNEDEDLEQEIEVKDE